MPTVHRHTLLGLRPWYCCQMATDADRAYQDNLELSKVEYQQRQVYLNSRPRCLSLVLGNACNIDCIHCYQAKNLATI